MKKAKKNNAVIIAGSILAVIIFACVFCRFFMTKDPTYMDLENCNISPNKEFFFGTDTMGRDIFSMILYGGRISLFIGLISTVLSTTIAVIYGSFSGIAPEWLDELMMRFTEILLSILSSGVCRKELGCCNHRCNRSDQLDEYRKNSTHRGTTAP